MPLTWPQVLSWRQHRHFLDHTGTPGAVEVARRLVGVQAQVMSSAEQAVAARTATPVPDALAAGLAAGELIRTWAMRGTLHVLPVAEAVDVLALLAAARTWERGSWQKTFLTVDQVAAISDAAVAALAGGPLTRDELADAIVASTGDADLGEHLRSGWGAVLKPLAWQGLLCQAGSVGGRVTFARPDLQVPGWPGLPDAEDAGPRVVESYLGAYGPAAEAGFDAWLLRGSTPKKVLRGWFAELVASGRAVKVEVDGESLYARAEDVDALERARPSDAVRLLPAFDPWVLGPGTADPHLLDPARRSEVSRAAGWIAPVVLVGGRIAGTWDVQDGVVGVALFAEAPPVDDEVVAAEAAHLAPGLPVRVTRT
ncbi:MAG TPA: winged helix DNA-binding domain-containing protein [Kineosporiaceae bacterium]|nr:winged helix DNA-binding domain-containing protein [Kineosporiaceae bacterium]